MGSYWLLHAETLVVRQNGLRIFLPRVPIPDGVAFTATAQARARLGRRSLADDLIEIVGAWRLGDLYDFLHFAGRWLWRRRRWLCRRG
ncbi:MAG TPA: hypothetical protein VHY79_00055 [Rhizomicrobium sp.]|nr:hypothetical protein [Rhizomicrobium sp.]